MYVGCGGFDLSAVTGTGRGGIQCAADIDCTHLHIAQQFNHAVLILNRARFNHAGVVDYRHAEGISGFCCQINLSAIGLDELFVFCQGIERPLVDAVAEQAAVVQCQSNFVSCGEQSCAEGGADHTLVAHLRCEQSDVAAFGCGERALVNHAAA